MKFLSKKHQFTRTETNFTKSNLTFSAGFTKFYDIMFLMLYVFGLCRISPLLPWVPSKVCLTTTGSDAVLTGTGIRLICFFFINRITFLGGNHKKRRHFGTFIYKRSFQGNKQSRVNFIFIL